MLVERRQALAGETLNRALGDKAGMIVWHMESSPMSVVGMDLVLPEIDEPRQGRRQG
jgi:hypothetical protein